MPIDVAAEVSDLILETNRVERDSEAIYLEMGRLFPMLAAEMERSAEAAELSLRGLAELESVGKRLGGRVFIEESKAFFQSLYAHDASFLAKITESIQRLASLEGLLGRVRADSEEMEIISLNAMTFALKSGTAGKAFSVITDELKRISGMTIGISERVTAAGRTLLEFFGRLRAALSELDAFQRSFFYSLYESIGKGYDDIEAGLSSATVFFSSLLDEARRVRGPVLEGMNEVQLQDIVRQSLEHVAISLAEARRASDSVGRDSVESRTAAFIAAVAELSEELIEDIAGKIGSSAAAFGSDMDAISALVGSCGNRRAEFLSSSEESFGKIDAEAFTRGSGRYLEQKRGVVSMASTLASQVKGLDESFKGLAALLARFQNIVVASRIEVAKTRALAGVSNTVDGMVELTGRIESDVDSATEMTKEFIALSHGAVEEFSSGEAADDAKLVSVLSALDEGIRALQSRRDTVLDAISSFSLCTPELKALVDRAVVDLGGLRELRDGLMAVGARLKGMKESLREGMAPGEIEPEPERMRRMVERFTIFTHKKAAADIGNFEVEEGTLAGEVTLF
jgi:hypothetical protein